MTLARGFWFAALAVFLMGSPAAAVCPQSCYGLSFGAPPDSCFTDATFDRCVAPFFGGGGCLKWDLTEASWRVTAPYNNLIGGIQALVSDEYTIEGPASAIPIAVGIGLELEGEISLGCAGLNGQLNLEVEFIEGAANSTTFSRILACGEGEQIDTILSLQASHLVGQPFRVASEIIAGAAYGHIEVNGRLSFEVPKGYRVVSCQGFVSEPLSIEASTWTRTKALYR